MLNIDFIVNLPKSRTYDAIMVIIDRFTKTGIGKVLVSVYVLFDCI